VESRSAARRHPKLLANPFLILPSSALFAPALPFLAETARIIALLL
jgi:hypothetical protein